MPRISLKNIKMSLLRSLPFCNAGTSGPSRFAVYQLHDVYRHCGFIKWNKSCIIVYSTVILSASTASIWQGGHLITLIFMIAGTQERELSHIQCVVLVPEDSSWFHLFINPQCMREGFVRVSVTTLLNCYIPHFFVKIQVSLGFLRCFQRMYCVNFVENA